MKLDPERRAAWQEGGTYPDLSSIAKGHGVDRAAQALDALGATGYLVEVGGELRARACGPTASPGAWPWKCPTPATPTRWRCHCAT